MHEDLRSSVWLWEVQDSEANWRNCRTSIQYGLVNHWTHHTDWLISVHRYQQPHRSPKVITRTVTRNSLVLNMDRWRQWCGTRQMMLNIPRGHLWLKIVCIFCSSGRRKMVKKGKTWTSDHEPLFKFAFDGGEIVLNAAWKKEDHI